MSLATEFPIASASDTASCALPASKACVHCGTAFRPTAHRPDFCCTGCQFVHVLIAQNQLGQFYDLQSGELAPVKSLVFNQRNYTWLEELATQAEQQDVARLSVEIQGLSCLACAWLIEKLFARAPGALTIRVNPSTGTAELCWQPGVFQATAFAQELQKFGYLVGPLGQQRKTGDRSLLIRLGLCGALALNTMLFTLPGYLGLAVNSELSQLFQRCSFFLGTLSLLIGGWYFFQRSWRSLQQRMLHIDLPISAGLLAAYAGSVYAWLHASHESVYFDFVSTFTFLMLVGRWTQQLAVERNRSRLLSAQTEQPPVVDAETGAKLPVQELSAGRAFLVAAGQTIPVRARLDAPLASVSLEWINGESEPTTAPRGRALPAGSVNCGLESIRLIAMERWEESFLAKLTALEPTGTARNQALERFIAVYLVVVLSLATLGFLGWWQFRGDLPTALQVLVSVLVVSCPCASGVAVPLCSDLAVARLRKLGVFVRNVELWRKLQGVRKVVFDKTGTLTLESISLQNPEAISRLNAVQKTVLMSLVQGNPHPVSRCLSEELQAVAPGSELLPGAEPCEAIGRGMELVANGSTWRLGKSGWAGDGPGDTVFSRDGEVLARFSFSEEAREDARHEIAALQRRGHEVYVLSGDRPAKVAAMARKLGLPAENALASLSPDEKASWLCDHNQQDTLFLGDGANDSLAFDAAWCTGTPAVDRGLLEQKADFYFLGRGLSGVRALLEAAALHRNAVHRVIAFALLYNAFAVLLCLSGRMTPMLAAILMPASSLASIGLVTLSLQAHASSGWAAESPG